MSKPPMHIFLVDDDLDDRLFFEEAIQCLDMNVSLEMFSGGQELIEYFQDKAKRLPDLLFLDLNMPVVDGMECLEKIRGKDHLKEIIVAIYSTSASEKDIEETFIKGANIYIQKPNNFDQLKKSIKKILQLNWHYHLTNLDKEAFLFRL